MAKRTTGKAVWQHYASYSPELVESHVGDRFVLHSLEMENLLKRKTKPKLFVFKDHIFVRFFMIDNRYELQPIIYLADANGILSFSEKSLPWQKDIEKILHEGEIRTGHFLYHLFDETAENHLHHIDRISEDIRKIQEEVFDNPFSNDIGHRIFDWRNRIHTLRKCVEEEIEVVRKLARSDLPYVDEDTGFYLQDLEDDLTRVVDALDAFQEQLLGIIDLQTSLKADHMNVIMKTLTLVSVIFIPMTFVAGIYGMNFEFMPELHWKYGYLGFWVIVLCIATGIISYFKQRRWW